MDKETQKHIKTADHNGISERSVGMMKNTVVPVWEKYMLTIEEASKYFGIGENKLRRIVDEPVSYTHLTRAKF